MTPERKQFSHGPNPKISKVWKIFFELQFGLLSIFECHKLYLDDSNVFISRGIFSRDDLDFETEIDGVKLGMKEHDSYFDIELDGKSFKDLYKKEKKKKR